MFYEVIMYKCCTDLNANILTNASDSVKCFTTKKLGTTAVSQILHQMEHYITLELLNNTSPRRVSQGDSNRDRTLLASSTRFLISSSTSVTNFMSFLKRKQSRVAVSVQRSL